MMDAWYNILQNGNRRWLLAILLALSLAFPAHSLFFSAHSLFFSAHPLYAQDTQPPVYLPIISVTTVSNSSTPWPLNDQEQQLELLFRNDPEQHRKNPTRNDILSKVARARAEDMAARNYFSHTDPDGHEANFLVNQAGYQLPDYFPHNGNNIESIGLNYATANEVWQAWKSSPAHRVHVLGEERFFAEETDYGLGYAENSTSKYWVIITAHH